MCDLCAGETIPASDSEDEGMHQESQLEGAGRERSMWVMQRMVRELGTGRDVIAALAKRFHASEGLPTGSVALPSTVTKLMLLLRFRESVRGTALLEHLIPSLKVQHQDNVLGASLSLQQHAAWEYHNKDQCKIVILR